MKTEPKSIGKETKPEDCSNCVQVDEWVIKLCSDCLIVHLQSENSRLESENQALREAPKAILEDITSLDFSALPDAVRCSLISLIEAVFAKHGVKK